MRPLCYIVTEGATDAAFVNRLFRDSIRNGDLSIVQSQGRSDAVSGARTLLVYYRRPVALFVDADSVDERAVDERRAYIEESLRAAASETPWKVVLARPELEAYLFESPTVANELFPNQFTADTLETAQIMPKKALAALIGSQDSARFFNRLSDSVVAKLLELPDLKELNVFVSDAISQPV